MTCGSYLGGNVIISTNRTSPCLSRRCLSLRGLLFIIPQYCCSVGRDPRTVSRILNRRFQDSHTERRTGFQRPAITNSREDRHVTCMALMDRIATSLESFSSQNSSKRESLSLRLLLTLHTKHKRLQWYDQRRTWTLKWSNLMFLDESRFCFQHHKSYISVWCHRGEGILPACIRYRHTGLSPGVMLWGAIGYTSRSPLVRIPSNLNSSRYISDLLKPVVVPFI
ncbi:hypothetical protein LAZ67_1003682 [Cordylochernes scorpioides]|uniref:Transposase n=1 Tax=Cordylochernes scorpioides TaxID=51811 RepID=A0ABY6JX15_9ARAC|nr:hypothetical protein LAZ67_1003682 [Cordylochernes scorpioides]